MSIMKTITLRSANAVSEIELENLLQEVRQIISSENVMLQTKKVFTSAQLSRIQNLKKRIVIRKGFIV
jgi:hypothetical protein